MPVTSRKKRVSAAAPTNVVIDFPDSAGHRIGVELSFRAPVENPEVVFATWTTGSYLIREFARQVEDFSSSGSGGRRLAWTKAAKNSWRIGARAGEEICVRFRVYAHEISVRTPYVDESRAFLSPAGLVPFVRGLEHDPYRVRVVTAPGWRVDVALPEERGGDGNVFLAEDFDHLVDSPFEVGTHRRLDFRTLGRAHRLTFTGEGNADPRRCQRDFEAIIRETAALFGGLPYERYLMIVHLQAGARGGLEHRDSAVCDHHRFGFVPEKEYEEFLGLVAHEYFHTWNVKRIKPAAFTPYDYENECYTRLLWAMEGTTSYYEWILLLRAGLLSKERYLTRLVEKINRLSDTPGRLRKPLSEASFDTWIKLYRPDEHSPNSNISYYEKGELVALLLDLEIRSATSGKRSYDDLMRLLWKQYGRRGVGIPEDGYRPAAEEIAQSSLRTFWSRYVEGTKEIDWDEALSRVGYRLEWSDGSSTGWLGVKTKTENGRLILDTVYDGSPAARSGLSAGDEILAIGRKKVEVETFGKRIEQLGPRGRSRIAVFRNGDLVEVPVTLGPKPRSAKRIVELAGAPAESRSLGRAWLAERKSGAASKAKK